MSHPIARRWLALAGLASLPCLPPGCALGADDDTGGITSPTRSLGPRGSAGSGLAGNAAHGDDDPVGSQSPGLLLGSWSGPPLLPGLAYSSAICTFIPGESAIETVCEYPGAGACSLTDGHDDGRPVICGGCNLPQGAQHGGCCDPDDDECLQLFDPFAGRPGDLPAPGECVTSSVPDGSCTTCTFDDQSAVSTCDYPGVTSCAPPYSVEDPACTPHECITRCATADGPDVFVRNSPIGPRPFPVDQLTAGTHAAPQR